MKWYVLISMAGVDAIAATTVTQGRLDTSGGLCGLFCSRRASKNERGGGKGRQAGSWGGLAVSFRTNPTAWFVSLFFFSFLGVGGRMGLKVREYFRVPRLGEPEGPGRRRQLPCRLPSNVGTE